LEEGLLPKDENEAFKEKFKAIFSQEMPPSKYLNSKPPAQEKPRVNAPKTDKKPLSMVE